MAIIILIGFMVLFYILSRRRRKKRILAIRDATNRNKAQQAARIELLQQQRIYQAAAKQAEKDRITAEKQAAADRKRAFQVKQARDDISHYEQQKRDYLNLYTASESVYRDPNKPVKARQAAYAEMIGYDSKIRGIEKKIEHAAFIVGTV